MSLDGDLIIHPRNQGTGSEAEFIERWADRKERRTPAQPAETQRVPMRTYDAEFKARFRAMHAAGMTYRRMEADLGVPRSVLQRLRDALKLPLRNRRVTPAIKEVNISVKVSKDLDRRISLHCSGRYKSKAHFIRFLINERIG